jgi:lipopolysaccharide cholinephosphotransferase
MSEREQAKQIIDTLPDYKMQAILMFLRGVEFGDELEDDRFCEELAEKYENDPDKGQFITEDELCKELGIIGNSPREGTLEEPVYKEALTCAWQRFGYPKALAEGRTRILCSEEEGEMEYLAEEIRSFLVHKEWQGEVYKLLGDIRKKQGRTREAFENYFLALDHEPHPYIKNELSRIFLEDLYDGSRRTGFFAKKADVTEFLNSWLDKYKSQEELQKLLKRIL